MLYLDADVLSCLVLIFYHTGFHTATEMVTNVFAYYSYELVLFSVLVKKDTKLTYKEVVNHL